MFNVNTFTGYQEHFSDVRVQEVDRMGRVSTMIYTGIKYRTKTDLTFLAFGAWIGRFVYSLTLH